MAKRSTKSSPIRFRPSRADHTAQPAMTHREIAEVLDMKVSTVSETEKRAKAKIAKALAEDPMVREWLARRAIEPEEAFNV